MALIIYKDGEIWREAREDRTVFVPTFESEKVKDPTPFNVPEKDEKEGLTPTNE